AFFRNSISGSPDQNPALSSALSVPSLTHLPAALRNFTWMRHGKNSEMRCQVPASSSRVNSRKCKRRSQVSPSLPARLAMPMAGGGGAVRGRPADVGVVGVPVVALTPGRPVVFAPPVVYRKGGPRHGGGLGEIAVDQPRRVEDLRLDLPRAVPLLVRPPRQRV